MIFSVFSFIVVACLRIEQTESSREVEAECSILIHYESLEFNAQVRPQLYLELWLVGWLLCSVFEGSNRRRFGSAFILYSIGCNGCNGKKWERERNKGSICVALLAATRGGQPRGHKRMTKSLGTSTVLADLERRQLMKRITIKRLAAKQRSSLPAQWFLIAK